jgi:membrane-associated phospholipid phosphatase
MSRSSRLLALLNVAMADAGFTIWKAKRVYGADPAQVTWRPVTAIPLADGDGNAGTSADPGWLPLVTTPSHPEYPAGHPALNGAAATVLLASFDDVQEFTLTTRTAAGVDLPPRSYTSISRARADGDDARVWGGMHYPSTVAASDAVGDAVARHVLQSAMSEVR